MEMLLKPNDVASALKISRHALRLLVRRGQLPAVRLSRKTERFRPVDVARLMQQSTTRAA